MTTEAERVLQIRDLVQSIDGISSKQQAFEEKVHHQLADFAALIENMGNWMAGMEGAEKVKDIRRRTSTSQSVKGVVTGDQTIETHGYSLEEQMVEFDAQEKAIRGRFPAAQGE
jgi:hypothetical protein